MASSGLIRWGAIGLALGGVTWVASCLLAAIGLLQAIPGREDVVLFVAALLLSTVGLVRLRILQKDRDGWASTSPRRFRGPRPGRGGLLDRKLGPRVDLVPA